MSGLAHHINISIGAQVLSLYEVAASQDRWDLPSWRGGIPVMTFPVSTALNGSGQEMGSFKTPLGRHRIRAKIGAAAPLALSLRGPAPHGRGLVY